VRDFLGMVSLPWLLEVCGLFEVRQGPTTYSLHVRAD